MTRAQLERHQVWCYLGAVAVGVLLGRIWDGVGSVVDVALWPMLAALLLTTFLQIPLEQIPASFRDRRFLTAALVGNFVVLPLLVWALVQITPDEAPLRLGLLLVLLVPCTDWFITFAHVGRGDGASATAFTPVALVVQLLLLPVYLWLMAGADAAARAFAPQQAWPALLVVLVPLALAFVADRWLGRSGRGEAWRERAAWGPVPLLALVLLMVAAAHAGEVLDRVDVLGWVAVVSVAFVVAALAVAVVIGRVARLPVRQSRTLAFSFTTRNSFLVLPFALAMPVGWELAAIVIVAQSLVELLLMALCVWLVPTVVMPDRRGALPRAA